MNWKRVGEIARWEYVQKARTKGFIAGLVVTPLLLIAMMSLPGLLALQDPDSTQIVGIVDKTGDFFEPLKRRIENTHKLDDGSPAFLLVDYTKGVPLDSALARADRDALNDTAKVEGIFVLAADADKADTLHVQYRSTNPSNLRVVERFETAIERTAVERRLATAGIDTTVFNSIQRPVDMSTVKVTESGSDASSGFGGTYIASYIGLLLLAIMVMSTGQQLVRGLVEEKSNRIIELLVSTISSSELMWGKLIGLSALGVTMIVAWVGIGALGAMYISSRVGGIDLSIDVMSILPLITLYVILGYCFYSALFIAVGSMASTEQGAQTATAWLSMFLLAIPLSLAFAVMLNPEAGYVRVLSFIPLITSSMMMVRIVTKMPPVWEIVATLSVLAASTAVVAWAAAKIFRTAILLYGKKLSFREVMRWLREA